MSLTQLVVAIALIGILLCAINALVPMTGFTKSALNITVLGAVVLTLFQMFGVIAGVGPI